MVLRFWILIAALVVSYSFLLFHVSQLQIANGIYAAKAGEEYAAANFANASRGIIYFTDKNGNSLPAALNKDFPLVYAVPSAIQDAGGTASTLAEILGEPA